MRICVYSSSSEALDPDYFDEAYRLGECIAQGGHELIYGAGDIGLMGACAQGLHARGGRLIGVIPEALNRAGIVCERCDELHVTRTMRERKAIMEGTADAFVALPGGYGTLEELLEVITLKQLQYHNKPIVILNTRLFYDPLLAFFETMIEQRFAKGSCRGFYHVAHGPDEALGYIESYVPADHEPKWWKAQETHGDRRNS